MHCVGTIKIIKQIEKMPNLGKGSVFQSTVQQMTLFNVLYVPASFESFQEAVKNKSCLVTVPTYLEYVTE